MSVKLPMEVQEFAKDYFAAEDRAAATNKGRVFRTVDQKSLALKCKALLESGAVENMYQLSKDLTSYRAGNSPHTHTVRLNKFTSQSGVVLSVQKTYATAQVATKAKPPAVAVVTTPQLSVSDLRKALDSSITKALNAGMSLRDIQEQAMGALSEQTKLATATSRLQSLMRETGLSTTQLAEVVATL